MTDPSPAASPAMSLLPTRRRLRLTPAGQSVASMLMRRSATAGQPARLVGGLSLAGFIGAVGLAAASALLSAGLAWPALATVCAGIAAVGALRAGPVFRQLARDLLSQSKVVSRLQTDLQGIENLRDQGPVVYIANRQSDADTSLLVDLIGRPVIVAETAGQAELTPLGARSRVQTMAPPSASADAARALRDVLRGGGAVLVQPGNRTAGPGSARRAYRDAGWLADVGDCPVVPISIDGLEASPWAPAESGRSRRRRPRVRVVAGEAERLQLAPHGTGRPRRIAAAAAVRDLLERHRYAALNHHRHMPAALDEAIARLGGSRTAVSDSFGTALSLDRIRIGAAALGRELAARTDARETVGVMLPTVAGLSVALWALWRHGRVPAMLNPTLGPGPALSSLRTAGVRRILASRKFIEAGGIGPVIDAATDAGIEVLMIEDLRARIGPMGKLRGLVVARAGAAGREAPASTDPAAVLFTSGSEGAPKGVVLTHANLLANIAQLRARADIGPADRVVSALPAFHSFGLTAGILLPVVAGSPVAVHPSPLHFRAVPKLAGETGATILFGTDTFLSGWARRAEAGDFANLRAAIAGAEPVKEATRAHWLDTFGVPIFEGYGATETAPVLSLNTPEASRDGSVGRLLPGLAARLEPVPGLPGGRLWVRGPNVMAGYLRAETPEELLPPPDGWYDTGDIVSIDSDGFLHIEGRAKRFAKVGGEMVSLAAVEALAAEVWPEAGFAALAQPDAKKGQRVVLVTDAAEAERGPLRERAAKAGMAEILLPAEIRLVDEIPVLASGKTDYPAVEALVSDANTGA